MPPGGHEDCRGGVPVAPGVPAAVHLVAEAEDDRATVGADGLGVGGQIAVVVPGCDGGEADALGVDLDERNGTVLSRGRGETRP